MGIRYDQDALYETVQVNNIFFKKKKKNLNTHTHKMLTPRPTQALPIPVQPIHERRGDWTHGFNFCSHIGH